MIDKALIWTAKEERTKLYLDAKNQSTKDMPIAPIYQYVKSRLVSPNVGGFPVNNAEDKIYSKDLYITAK